MEQFRITVIKSGRSVAAILLIVFSVLLAIFLVFFMEAVILKIVAPIATLTVLISASVYFMAGTLVVITDDKTLTFNWEKKVVFNFKAIEDLKLEEIKILVINTLPGEEKEHLLSIRTANRKIKVQTPKYWRKDTDAFIHYLRKNTNAEIKDSWDMLKEQGLLKIVYYSISFILLAGIFAIGFALIDKGIKNIDITDLIRIIGPLLALFPFWLAIKSKVK